MKDRVIALAGLLQCCELAQRIAETGDAESTPLRAAMHSVFAIDAESAEAVYGNADALKRGLHRLLAYVDGGERDPRITRMAVTVLHLERRLAAAPNLLQRIRRGIEDVQRQVDAFGMEHPGVLTRLGELYAATLSTLRPRVLVQGNPNWLGQANVVAEIRAVLLAALRSAVLWRQMGGSYWDLLLRRSDMTRAARGLLHEH